MTAWWAYRRGMIRLVDLRAWFASFEIVARRCAVRDGLVPCYRVHELSELLGSRGGGHTRGAVRRLVSSGLLRWAQGEVAQLRRPIELVCADRGELEATLCRVPNRTRRVPVPRRVLRMLAACGRPVVIATTLGHLLRCVYYREGGVRPDGLCKASWVADVFEVDERNVKGARSLLCRLGVLERERAPQRVLNRHGGLVRWNLRWQGVPLVGARRSPPLGRTIATGTPPPRETGNSSLRRSENQKPGTPAPSGVRKRTGDDPRLSRVLRSDLVNAERLFKLYCEAVDRRQCQGSEAGRQQFFAAAAHAMRVGERNVCGLFATVVRRGLWHHATAVDEDTARRLLRGLPAQDCREAQSERSSGEEQEVLSRDEIASLIRRSLASRR